MTTVKAKIASFCDHIGPGDFIFVSKRYTLDIDGIYYEPIFFYSCKDCADRNLTPEEQQTIFNKYSYKLLRSMVLIGIYYDPETTDPIYFKLENHQCPKCKTKLDDLMMENEYHGVDIPYHCPNCHTIVFLVTGVKG